MSENNELQKMETFIEDMSNNRVFNEGQIIQELEIYLNNGGSIDFMFRQKDIFDMYYFGTILHYSAEWSYKRLAEYALSKGANLAIERSYFAHKNSELRHPTALDLSAKRCNMVVSHRRYSVFKMLKNRSLELYSSHGLTPFHLYCAIKYQYWNHEAKSCFRTADVNAAVSAESPFWPGKTPIMIAARCENEDLVTRLLDLGADPLVSDRGNNTPLHWLSECWFHDERLFAIDGRDTHGSFTGEYHFHVACCYCPKTLHIVKRYLDQGISPDLPMDLAPDQSILHNITNSFNCPKMIQLLLEYGADIEKKDLIGNSPLEHIYKRRACSFQVFECVLLVIEVGANMERVDKENFLEHVSKHEYFKELFLTCILRLKTLNENLVSELLKNVYIEVSNSFERGWDETEYTIRCLKELKTLSDSGWSRILDDSVIVDTDFEKKFSWLDNVEFPCFPIYGKMLRIKVKRKLLEVRQKKRKIPQIVPQLQRLVQSLCHLPHLCAEAILWSFKSKELDQFLELFSNQN